LGRDAHRFDEIGDDIGRDDVDGLTGSIILWAPDHRKSSSIATPMMRR
jgi:hypothetical protein